jgi:hypothetical protein
MIVHPLAKWKAMPLVDRLRDWKRVMGLPHNERSRINWEGADIRETLDEAADRISQLDVGLEQAKKIIRELLHFADGHELRSREAQLLKGLNVQARDFLLKKQS